MIQLQSYVLGGWSKGQAPFRDLVNPATDERVAQASSNGLDMAAVMDHARTVGGPSLRAMSFEERGAMLRTWSKALYAAREALLDVTMVNAGSTRGDAKFDVDGATGTLSYYAGLGKKLGDRKWLVDGESEQLTRNSARFYGMHIRVPIQGAAVHIGAFNFPAWGTFAKAAVSILAGVPVVTKPASSTAWITYEMVKVLTDQGLIPPGVLQLICGSPGTLLDHLGPQDALAFTGSADTGAKLRGGHGPVHASTAVNIEADSLNAMVLGPDLERGSDLYHWVKNSIVLEMTQKAGQKCTAVRRVVVPESLVDALTEDLSEELARISIGDPRAEGVRMGPLNNRAQQEDYREGVALLSGEGRIVYGDPERESFEGVKDGQGAFASPILLRCDAPLQAEAVHAREVFGPVVTLCVYDGSVAQAAAIVAKGQGMLASTVASSDRKFGGELVFELAPYNGRLMLIDKKVCDQATPHGMVLPNLNHGGPGRAGGGAELGGLRGMEFYMRRVAIQGNRGLLDKLFA